MATASKTRPTSTSGRPRRSFVVYLPRRHFERQWNDDKGRMMHPDDYTTRVATLRDRAGVGLLLQAAYPLLMGEAYDEPLLSRALEHMTKPNLDLLSSGTYYAAVSSAGSVIGCGGWTAERPGSGTVEEALGHLRHFGTHPDWTNRGVGRAIYARCESSARTAGISHFECYASLNAEGFYRSLGFEVISAIEVEMGPELAFPSVRMRRSIR